ncbi:MAG: PbpA [Proteobacteria bacterium]|nr:PbpA [Pseudomonadota bacterium]
MPYSDWRASQNILQRGRTRGRLKKRLRFAFLSLLGLAGLAYLVVAVIPSLFNSGGAGAGPDVVLVKPGEKAPIPEERLDKKQLARIIGPHAFQIDEIRTFKIDDEQGHSLFVRTTMDPALQTWALRELPKVNSLSAALVAMSPKSGEVLAMASFRADGRPINMALNGNFPAASLFKIVTAAAAVENQHLSSSSTLAYDGRKHTLYKQHIKGGIQEGSNEVTLKEGFADSINTVFGKLGAFSLGPKALEGFARRFQFNQPIIFEMPVQKSRFEAPEGEDPYRMAELASGFNRTTRVSPLHGAMLASAIVNGGRLMEPTVVREVFDMDNNIYYEHKPVSLGQVVSPRTVKELREMMDATVTEGTGRKRFRDLARHKVLSKLEIGGKSGSIDDEDGHRVDWFVSYAQMRNGGESLALAALVVHGEKMGRRSQELVREAIIHYFGPRLKAAGGAEPKE